MDLWKGDLQLPEGGLIKDVHLSQIEHRRPSISIPPSSLRILAIVDIARIPLYLAVGPSLEVWTECLETEDWFSTILLQQDRPAASKDAQWWDAAGGQSLLGILCGVSQSEGITQHGPTITEVLLYGTISLSAGHERVLLPTTTSRAADETLSTDGDKVSHSSALHVRALLLSSNLLYRLPSTTTPPLSPSPGHAEFADHPHQIDEAQFLPPLFPPSRDDSVKSKDLPDVFEQATERRKTARRKGGESVAAAASRVDGSSVVPSHRKSLSVNKTSQVHTLEDVGGIHDVAKPNIKGAEQSPKIAHAISSTARSLSRSASLPMDNRSHRRRSLLNEPTKSSPLSHAASLADSTGEPNFESRNKDFISRLVMAGMRLYGLQQSKPPTRPRRASAMLSPAGFDNDIAQETPEDRGKNEEYKLVYHQTYKGAVFAFRNHLATTPLHVHPDCLRETVDRLLAIYCGDPLLTVQSGFHSPVP